jgi:hypothetical protein
LPSALEHKPSLGNNTRFEFPFNNPKKPCEEAYAEVEADLIELAETTLRFLSHLESIGWQIGQSVFGEVLRVRHSDIHFEVLKQPGGKTSTSSHYLKFDQVAVAFALDFLPNVQQFSPKMPLAKQLKVIPAAPGKVAVFFPAEKEVSNCDFTCTRLLSPSSAARQRDASEPAPVPAARRAQRGFFAPDSQASALTLT